MADKKKGTRTLCGGINLDTYKPGAPAEKPKRKPKKSK